MKTLVTRLFSRFGYELNLRKWSEVPGDIGDKDFEEIFYKCKDYTMTQVYRMYSLYMATRYISMNHIKGDFVECGVWKGGSAMLSAFALMDLHDTTRDFYLYDTYEGMSEPTEKDKSWKYDSVKDLWQKSKKNGVSDWCYAGLDEVKNNLYKTGYPQERFKFIKGKVEDTIPASIPQSISLLRLDTDWYESTCHELVHLYPLVSRGGVIILDDYGFWKGSREAVDEYFAKNNIHVILNRIDGSGRIFIKP
jgi:O-methyltransferase